MGVSIQCYRIRIGSFQPNKIKHSSSRMKSTTKHRMSLILHLLLSLFMIGQSETNPYHISTPALTLRYLTLSAVGSSTLGIEWQPGLQGSCAGLTNKVCHLLNGNRQKSGLKLCSWNCGRALTDKMIDIKLFVQNHKPVLFAIIEADLHGSNSSANRRTSYTTEDINSKFEIEGYSIILPDTWNLVVQARIIVMILK